MEDVRYDDLPVTRHVQHEVLHHGHHAKAETGEPVEPACRVGLWHRADVLGLRVELIEKPGRRGRAREVVVFAYGDKATDVWWAQNATGFAKLANLRVLRISAADTQALAGLAERTMAMQCTIQDGELMITGAAGTVHVVPGPMGTAV